MKLEIKDIRKNFGDTEVLHGISFEVESGRALGLLGRNGAGKTTTIRIIMDVFKANSGELYLDGKVFEPRKQQIGYLPEERGLYPKKTVMEQILYLARLRGMSAKEARVNARKWLERLEVSEYASRKLETLSKGNQQKVQLASTLVCNPKMVILDEPFSGLDPVNSQILKDVVNELIKENHLVIFSSHQMSYVEEFCEQITVINHGSIVLSGDLKEIKRDYGKNRLTLSAENYSTEQLERICEQIWKDKIILHKRKKDYLVLETQNGITKKMLLQDLAESDIDIAHFGIYEPSLNDIFVAKVGDEEEEA